jgi:hypothetical protein
VEYKVFQTELYNGIPNVTVWRMLRKRLRSKAYKLSIVLERCFVCCCLYERGVLFCVISVFFSVVS